MSKPGATTIFQTLLGAGFECYLVGGSVRDRLLGRTGGDLDFATNARPPDLLRLFPRSYYPNTFGTVLVDLDGSQYEITTYRGEGRYGDRRHPDRIEFVDRLEDDLKRRDFTINAMAMDVEDRLVDPFGGEADLRLQLLRAVGDPVERLSEDPLRMMRAARLATLLAFTIETGTWQAIVDHASLLALISRERVRDELLKILASEHAVTGIDFLDHLNLLPDVLPALAALRRLNRPPEEELDAYQHALASLRCCRGDALLRLAALLHVLDEVTGYRGKGTGHAGVGAQFIAPAAGQDAGAWASPSPQPSPAGERQEVPTPDPRHPTPDTLVRLRLSAAQAERVRRLIEAIASLPEDLPATAPAVRRLLSAHGAIVPDLLLLVEAHRRALGRPAALTNLRQLRELRRLTRQARREGAPLTIADLAIGGDELMRALDLPGGPEVGRLLRLLLDRVLDDPALNTAASLLRLARAFV